MVSGNSESLRSPLYSTVVFRKQELMRIFVVAFLSIATATAALGADDRALEVNQLFSMFDKPTHNPAVTTNFSIMSTNPGARHQRPRQRKISSLSRGRTASTTYQKPSRCGATPITSSSKK